MTDHDENEDLPAELVAALKQRERPADVITRRVDREISAMAAAQFAARKPAPRRRAWAAVAATAVLSIFLVTISRDPAPGRDELYTDVDGSGQIDIADVLALARDGHALTQSDLDAFAAHIVSLSGDDS